MSELPEILFIDKPYGITSFDVIRELRKHTGIRKFGHAGTLDPLATGLMIIGVEKGTKKLESYLRLDKEYVAEVLLGESRTTGDLEGSVVEEKDTPSFTHTVLEETLQTLTGKLLLPVSAYSAIKKDGVVMYKKARRAEKNGLVIADVPEREMEVFTAKLVLHEPIQKEGKHRHVATVRFHVGSGTYIRSLAVELGKRLGYPATLQGLRRTKIGEYTVEDARALDSFAKK